MSYSIIGTGVMGGNLALNIAQNNRINLHNRTMSKVTELITKNPDLDLVGHDSIIELVDNTKSPRTIITMLPHGDKTTKMVSMLSNVLSKDDYILDMANDYYVDSRKRFDICNEKSIKYLDCGISGGFKGALNGPSLMIGGPRKYYDEQKNFFDTFCGNHQHIGEMPGNGHYAKMVHNGIEYAMLQGIADIYTYCNKDITVMQQVLTKLQDYPIYGYLIESAKIVCDKYDLESIDDVCKMNNTGLWCTMIALKRSIPLSVITNSVLNRIDSKIEHTTYFDGYNCKVDIHSACNALQFIYSQALLEGYNLLISEGINISRSQNAWSKSSIIECKLITEDLSILHEMNDVCYGSAKKVLLECVFNNCNTPVLASAVEKYNLSQDPKKNTNFIMAQRNDFGGHDIKYV